MFHSAGMLAPDGRCKTLDQAADGYVRSECCAALLLRRYFSTAPREAQLNVTGDQQTRHEEDTSPLGEGLWLLSAAVTQDGRSSSLTAPNGPAQQKTIIQAL
eukprot:6774904-Pyramimonas_sp.AAC.1